MTAKTSNFSRLVPKTILARVTSVIFIGVLIAQLLGTWVWVEQLKSSERDRMTDLSQSMGNHIGKAIGFFEKLPNQYRKETLEGFRKNGGTFLDFEAEFFVSMNPEYIDLTPISTTEFSLLVRDNIQKSMSPYMGQIEDLNLSFVSFENAKTMTPNKPLKGLTDNNAIVSLSPIWKNLGLIAPKDEIPIAVIQFRLNQQNGWMYLATIIPKGELLLSFDWINGERIFTSIAVSLTVLLLTFLFVRRIISPLKLLAHQADLLGRGRNPRQLEEKGSKEIVATIGAFNSMAMRIQKFITDRDNTFAAISHDLKTPLTRARLRVESIKDDTIKESLIGDLDYLGTMVTGSLQIISDGIEFEHTSDIDLTEMLETILKKEEIHNLPIKFDMKKNITMKGRALAIERLFSNLINNAMTYGKGVEVIGEMQHNGILIEIIDNGPGLSDADKENEINY